MHEIKKNKISACHIICLSVFEVKLIGFVASRLQIWPMKTHHNCIQLVEEDQDLHSEF